MNAAIDVRGVLPSIRVPTLVLHRTGDRCLKVEEGRFLAEHIPGATFVEQPGDDHLPFVGDQEAMLSEIERFLSRTHVPREPARMLASVLAVRPGPHGAPPRVLRQVFEREVLRWRGQILDPAGEVAAGALRRSRPGGAVRRGGDGRGAAACRSRRPPGCTSARSTRSCRAGRSSTSRTSWPVRPRSTKSGCRRRSWIWCRARASASTPEESSAPDIPSATSRPSPSPASRGTRHKA